MRSLYSLGAFKAAFALAQLLPRPVTRKLADALACWSLGHSPELEKITRDNLAVATGLSGEKLAVLVRENFRCFARMLADYFLCAGDHAGRANDLLESAEGWEHLTAAQAAGRGTILVTHGYCCHGATRPIP